MSVLSTGTHMTQECVISPLSSHKRLRTMVLLLHFEHSPKTSLFSSLSILSPHEMLAVVRSYYNWRASFHRWAAGRCKQGVDCLMLMPGKLKAAVFWLLCLVEGFSPLVQQCFLPLFTCLRQETTLFLPATGQFVRVPPKADSQPSQHRCS